MRLEKWQSLGNDYLVVERDSLPWELTAARVRMLCDVHTGLGSDGVLELGPSDERGFAARLRIFNPDGSEAELSGNGARQAAMYARARGWVASDQFSLQTGAGEVRATITGPQRCTLAMGRARLVSDDLPGGPQDGVLEVDTAGRSRRAQHVQVGNPQLAVAVDTVTELDALDLAAIGPGLERHPSFPNRTNVSFFTALAPDRVRARIFERGVGETSASGTGASGAAIAHVLRGGDSPVTVVLDGGELVVDVDDSLLFTLSGPAEHVYSAELSGALLARLAAA